MGVYFVAIFALLVSPTISAEILLDSSTLRFVHVIWRHGDRSPSNGNFPTDTNNTVSTWPQGWGELSDEGVKQHYELGRYFRERYVKSGFLSEDYKANEIYVRSTSYNRTIMSALANLAGMYPPPTDRKWSQNITWQPIPVHSIPKEMDPMLWMDMPCPVANSTYHDEVMKSEEVRRIEEENAEFLKFLLNATGLPKMTLDDIWMVFDPLNCELLHKEHKVPTWVTASIFNQIKQLSDIGSSFYYHDFRLQRLRGGLLFGEMAARMRAKAHNESTVQPHNLKYYVYSAHDETVMALLENLGVYNGHNPEYATAVIVELHQTNSGDHIVKVLHINQTGSTNPIPLVIKGCGATLALAQCSLDAFVTMANAHTPNDWYAECGITKADKKINTMTVAAIILGVTTGILLIVVIILVWKLKNDSVLRWASLGNVSS